MTVRWCELCGAECAPDLINDAGHCMQCVLELDDDDDDDDDERETDPCAAPDPEEWEALP